MKFIPYVLCALMACLLACTTINIANGPVNDPSEDVRSARLISEYKDLAKIMGIEFKHQIGLGMERIEESGVVGLCFRMSGYRHITLDALYWDGADSEKRIATIFHELTHCYCGREHDFNGVNYPEDSLKAVPSTQPEAYFEDSCPRSLMYPWVLAKGCLPAHYGAYILEMFKGCSPY